MGHTHHFSNWNQWTQTCHASRSRQCIECKYVETETRVWHDWHVTKDDRGRTVKRCRKCGMTS